MATSSRLYTLILNLRALFKIWFDPQLRAEIARANQEIEQGLTRPFEELTSEKDKES